MKRRLILLGLVILICMVFTGCGDKAQGVKEESPAPMVVDQEPAQSEAEDLQPLYGSQIEDGTYNIEVTSSSSMFRIIEAKLTVTAGEMSAVLTLSGTGYEKLYLGTGEEALTDSDDKCIYYVENAEGKYTYTVPVAALDQELDCTAWSIRKQKWYDRTLVFRSSLIPDAAIKAE